MSVPELTSKISSPEEIFQASLRRIYILIGEMRSDLTKSQDRLQNMFNSMVAQQQHFNIQMEPQVVSVSDISISEVLSREIFCLR